MYYCDFLLFNLAVEFVTSSMAILQSIKQVIFSYILNNSELKLTVVLI